MCRFVEEAKKDMRVVGVSKEDKDEADDCCGNP